MLYPAELMVRIFLCDGIISHFPLDCKAFEQKFGVGLSLFVSLFRAFQAKTVPPNDETASFLFFIVIRF